MNLPLNTMALVLAGGRGSRLQSLTDKRSKPAVPFGGKYRLIDFALSNCLNSGIGRIGVLTQYMSHSLNQHVQQGWRLTAADGSPLIELLPAQQRTSGHNWYAGTADAIYQNLDIIRAHAPDYVLILAGDHIYQMDYRPMIEDHVNSGAAMTIGSVEYPRDQASQFGVLAADEEGRVKSFVEKPDDPPSLANDPDHSLVSMGIYVFSAEFMYEQLKLDNQRKETDNDFGKDVIPQMIDEHHVNAFVFRDEKNGSPGYWRDVGTLDSFWQANLELIGVVPQLNLYDTNWPIRTCLTQAPPAKFLFDSHDRCGAAVNSMICDGCIISGALISNSLMFTNVTAEEHTEIDDSVILSDTKIGARCRIRRAVIDKKCTIPNDMDIGYDLALDHTRFEVTEAGIVLVTQRMLDVLAANPIRRIA